MPINQSMIMHSKNKKFSGFTLVEIMIVVAIIALLAAIAIPNLQRANKYAQFADGKKWVQSAVTAIELYQANTGRYPTDWTSLTSTNPPYTS